MHGNIARIRAKCWRCDTNTLSQPKEPPVTLPVPEYPFQLVCSDYFSLEGRQCLVMVDRYSGWPSVHQAMSEDSREFIDLLRTHCEMFGVPEELATYGGSDYVSQGTQQFLSI